MRAFPMKCLVRCLTLPFLPLLLAAAARTEASAFEPGPSAEATKKPAGASNEGDDLVVHEWGTFLSVQGSGGVSVGGVVASEELLPEFVLWHGDEDAVWRTLIRQKMETPVTYFYTPRPMTVRVRVDMPAGILTHWFPAVRAFGAIEGEPENAEDAKRREVPAGYEDGTVAGTFLDWGRFELIPDPGAAARAAELPGVTLPEVGPEDNWRFARETDAALVKVHGGDRRNLELSAYEKFLFYRGLGDFELPLRVAARGAGDGLALTFGNRASAALGELLVVEVGGDGLRFGIVGSVPAQGERGAQLVDVLGPVLPLENGVRALEETLVRVLVDAGLYCKEAEAMVATWEESYFRTPGLRALYILPRSIVDAAIPLRVEPAPRELVRVMLARVEILTPAREREIESLVRASGGANAATADAAVARLESLGRLLEPAVRRVLALTSDPAVEERAASLLAGIVERSSLR